MVSTTGHPIRIERYFQGPTDYGQGGWSGYRFAERLPTAVTLAMRAPVPLETELFVETVDDGWELRPATGAVIMHASPSPPALPTTTAISVDEAVAARKRYAETAASHPVPHCFSCGTLTTSMGVQAGPLDDDDRYGTDWTPPAWATTADGGVDTGATWAALDCAAAWYVSRSRGRRNVLTAQFTAEVLHAIEPNRSYAIVGWAGDESPEWDGRKRYGASAMFDEHGRMVARSKSFWLSIA